MEGGERIVIEGRARPRIASEMQGILMAFGLVFVLEPIVAPATLILLLVGVTTAWRWSALAIQVTKGGARLKAEGKPYREKA